MLTILYQDKKFVYDLLGKPFSFEVPDHTGGIPISNDGEGNMLIERALERIYSGQADTRFEEGLARSPVRDQEEAKLN